MNEYEVTWSTYIEADDPTDAALQVKGILQDPGNEAWNFAIKEVGGTPIVSIDLQYDDDPYIYDAKGQ